MGSHSSTVLFILTGFGVATALAAVALIVRAVRRRTHALETDIDHLHDEIWELREAAAARDRAEAANEAKSRFLANVTHEVRTPLNGILGMAELLGGTPLDAEQQTYVAAIRSSGSALASLIEEILDFAKIDAGKVELAEERFDVTALVEGVAELLAPRAQGKSLEIASTIEADVPRRLRGDAVRLRQILLNLAGNAVKFTETGGVGLRVRRADETGALLRFDIIDTGPGVPADRRAAIFEDFEQADGSTPRPHGGTGLGLAISKRLAERMGGALSLEPAARGKGSLFSIVLPLPADEEGAMPEGVSRPARVPIGWTRPVDEDPRPFNMSEHVPTAKPASACTGHALDGQHALIVAASPFEAPFLAARLAEAGAAVTHVENPAEGLAKIAARRFDVVIVDCALGQTATRDLGEAARATGVRRTLVLFSPFERRAFGQTSARGFDGWLVKPVRRQSLFSLLDGATALAPPTSPARPTPWTGRALNVLLAEDNEINALLATRHLQRLGATVTHAPDGLTALTLAEAALDAGAPYDAMVLDIRMPGLDGFELARRIRLAETARQAGPARLIALSADLVDSERLSATFAGIDECLGKPVSFARLQRALASTAEAVPGWKRSHPSVSCNDTNVVSSPCGASATLL